MDEEKEGIEMGGAGVDQEKPSFIMGTFLACDVSLCLLQRSYVP